MRVPGLSASGDQSASRGSVEPRYLVHGKVLIFAVGLATATIDGVTFPFNFSAGRTYALSQKIPSGETWWAS